MKKETVESQIVFEITQRIRSGRYAPDALLPPLLALAAEFQTSSTTISQALNRIRKKGLLETVRGKGTRVLSLEERPQTGTVGIVVTGQPALFSQEPSMILEGMYGALEKNRQHYRIVLQQELDGLLSDPQSLIDSFGGLLFIESGGVEEPIQKMQSIHFPYVVANLETPMNATCTWVDHQKTTRTAVLMLAAMGHQKIALVTRDTKALFYEDALNGYKNGLKQSGLIVDDALRITSDSSEALGAYHATKDFLETNELPDAFVACRDYLAYGVCKALKEKNILIGRDVSVIGFDNLTWPEKNSPLTTFNEPALELGAQAADMLIERMDSGEGSVEKREIDSPLILRRSVGLNSTPSLEPAGISLKLNAIEKFS